jgi:hypothetical protein
VQLVLHPVAKKSVHICTQTPGGSSTVHIYTQTPGGSSTVHIYTQTPGGSSTVPIYTQTVHRIQGTDAIHILCTQGIPVFGMVLKKQRLFLYTDLSSRLL